MYCEVHHEGIESRAQTQELVELLHIYTMIAPDTGVPAKSAIGSAVFERMKPFLMVLEPMENGEYRYLHYGSAIAAVAGFDMTGRCTSDFNNPIGALFRDIYEQVAGLQRPVYTISRAVKASHVHTWERLILPVRQEDGQIGFIVYNRPREFQNDFLRAVLDLVFDGIFALRGIRNDAGILVDAVIVAANPAAAAMPAAARATVPRRAPGAARRCRHAAVLQSATRSASLLRWLRTAPRSPAVHSC